MSSIRFAPERHWLSPFRLLAAVFLAFAGVVALPAVASAGPNDVELKSAFAKPIAVDRYPATYPAANYPVEPNDPEFSDDDPPTTGAPVPNAGEVNRELRCTPEPNGRPEYGTDGDWTLGLPINLYGQKAGGRNTSEPTTAPVAPGRTQSRDELTPALQAGASTDLCFGFTLTPNMQPELATTRVLDPSVPYVTKTTVPSEGFDYQTDLQSYDDLKQAVVTMPVGYAANLAAVGDGCSDADFGTGRYTPVLAACSQYQVGTAFVRATEDRNPRMIAMGGHARTLAPLVDGAAKVYLLRPGVDEIARLGVTVKPVDGTATTKFLVSLRLTPDGRIQATTDNAPRRLIYTTELCTLAELTSKPACSGKQVNDLEDGAHGAALYVETIGIRTWGKKADYPTLAADFSEWGTSCVPTSASVAVTTYHGVNSSANTAADPITLNGCDDLDFEPSLTIEPTSTQAASPSGAKITLDLGQATKTVGGETVKTALLKDAAVKLPPGLEIGAQAGSREGGLKLCTAAQFAKDASTLAGCPAGSKAGTVKIVSPLLGSGRTFEGSVFLGAQGAVGELPDLYIEAALKDSAAPGHTPTDATPRIKLVGKASADPATGQVTTTFDNNPQLRFSMLELSFPGGPDALFTTPRTCGTFSSDSTFRSWAKPTTDVTRSTSITISDGCTAPAFEPTYSLTPSNTEAGASAPVNVTIERPDRSAWLKDINVALPAGMLANLKLITDCSDADAAAGSCPEASRIATVTTTSGAGEQPYSLTGAMYLTQYKPGHVAYASIIVRAKVGDLDLGNVVVPGEIDLDPLNGRLSLKTSVPTRFRGIALNVRKVKVDIDREGFGLNPTACGPHATALGATGDGGETATAATSVAYTNCAAKPFGPSFSATLSSTKKDDYPTLTVDIGARPGDSNMKATTVDLPQFLAADVKNTQISRTCSLDGFNAGNCPASATVGSVTAKVSITDEVISGDVVLVNRNETLPGLGLVIKGRYATRVLSRVFYAPPAMNRLRTEFPAIPDLPLTSLKLVLPGSPTSPLKIANDTCATPKFDATFGGHGGQTSTASSPVACGPGGGALKNAANPKVKWTKKAGVSLTLSDLGGRKLKSAKFYLPKGLGWNTKNAKKKKAITVSVTGVKKVTLKRAKTTLTLSTTESTATGLSIKLKANTLKRAKSVKKGKRVSFKLKLGFTDGTSQTKTVKVKAP